MVDDPTATYLDEVEFQLVGQPPRLFDRLDADLLADQPAEVVYRLAAANRLPPARFEHSYTPTIVNTGCELVLFDTGNGAGRRSTGIGQLRARLAEAGYAPEDIDVVVITHFHPDHIGGNHQFETVWGLDTAYTKENAKGLSVEESRAAAWRQARPRS